MLNKLFSPTKSFYKICHYVCHDPVRVEILAHEGVRSYDYRLMARDFKEVRDLRPQNKKPVFHAVLDFHPDEKVENARMVEIAKKYLADLGYANAQYVIAKHTDKPHAHMHIIANRVDQEGQFVNGFWDMVRSAKIAKKLTEEYKLMPMAGKDLTQANLTAANKSYQRHYKLYRLIRDALPDCGSFPDLMLRLGKMGVETRIRRNQQTGQREGISFRYEGEAFKGCKVDAAFSLPRLQQTLSRQQLAIWEQEKIVKEPLKEAPYEEQKIQKTLTPEQKPKHKHKLRIS